MKENAHVSLRSSLVARSTVPGLNIVQFNEFFEKYTWLKHSNGYLGCNVCCKFVNSLERSVSSKFGLALAQVRLAADKCNIRNVLSRHPESLVHKKFVEKLKSANIAKSDSDSNGDGADLKPNRDLEHVLHDHRYSKDTNLAPRAWLRGCRGQTVSSRTIRRVCVSPSKLEVLISTEVATSEPGDDDGDLSKEELKLEIAKLKNEITELRESNAAQEQEIRALRSSFFNHMGASEN